MREIRRDMHKQREWRNELERMKLAAVVGCLNVESKTLRNILVPVTTRTLDQVRVIARHQRDLGGTSCLPAVLHVMLLF